MTGQHPQVVVVTGGIGRATAVAFAARGAKVALLARGAAGLDGAVAEIRAGGGEALAVPTDMADSDQVERAVAQVEQQLGPCGDPRAVVQPSAPPDRRDCLRTLQRTRYFSTSWVRRVSPLPGELVSGVREPP